MYTVLYSFVTHVVCIIYYVLFNMYCILKLRVIISISLGFYKNINGCKHKSDNNNNNILLFTIMHNNAHHRW